MNRVCLVGRITAKPELRYTGTNIPYTRFSLAVNRTFNNAQGEREADFINIVVWRRQAENIVNYLDKGSQVSIEGRIQTGSYTDQSGNRRYTTDVVADNVQFLDSRRQSEARATSTPYDYQDAPASSPAPQNDVNVEDDPFADFGDNVSIDDNFLE
ncbi:MAG TPA: single-stranded DNA-binding protein [Candidatus Coprosoma intestinipullorum]|uniref:Single-stranded DNA-binding protein n=1 Tax=Candidatus Coprosoma intestinipullorum TaxID=2840752 RepID=A0A9D1CZT8_9FIRM|nr:single-stranded DNA-binding protein [Candidatus Coprosoma intestinipullorum]